MKTYTIKITLKSPCLIGSGEGFGAVIDSDIVFDDLGIPYIPSKRIKGCLRDSAIEVCEMFESSQINLIDLTKDNQKNGYQIVSAIFGNPGDDKPAPVFFSNLTIEGYGVITEGLHYLISISSSIINRESIINQYTELRQQTAIDETKGVAKEHSLRTIRVAKKGLIFEGTIDFDEDNDEWLTLLFFACKNFRFMGTKRNRGFGAIECRLFEDSREINLIDRLEALCRQ